MMAEHEHTRTIHLYHIELPYGLDGKALEFDRSTGDMEGETFYGLVRQMEVMEFKEDEIRDVLTAAVALLTKYPHRKLTQALDTAMVWERG
jgi:hypothetical protein